MRLCPHILPAIAVLLCSAPLIASPLYNAVEANDVDKVHELLLAGANPNDPDRRWFRHPINTAARQGSLEITKLLHQHGATLAPGDNPTQWPLCIAAQHDHPDVVRYLLDAGAPIIPPKHRAFPFPLEAACSNSFSCVESIAEHLKIEVTERSEELIARRWNPAIIKLILGDPSSVLENAQFPLAHRENELHYYIYSPMVWAIIYDRKDLYPDLLCYHRPPRYTGGAGHQVEHLLSLAAALGRTEVMQLLIDNDAAIDPIFSFEPDTSPLSIAAMSGKIESVALLLESGADPSVGHRLFKSPLCHAAEQGHPEIIRMLLAAGADPSWGFPHNSYRPLHSAARKGNAECLNLLLSAGADPGSGAYPSYTPAALYRAAISAGSTDCVRLLIQHGVNPIENWNNSIEPFFDALRDNELVIAELLIDAGADPFISDAETGHNALHFVRWIIQNETDPARIETLKRIMEKIMLVHPDNELDN